MPYAVALALTLAVEVPIVVVVLGWSGVERGRAALLAVVANLLTHPVFGLLVADPIQHRLGALGLGLAEVAVILVEAVVYAVGARPGLPLGVAVATAALANAASLLVGLAALSW